MLSLQQRCSRARSAKLSCCLAAVEIRPKTQGLQLKQGSPQLVDAPQKDDVALFLHTSGTTSRPKVHVLKTGLQCMEMVWYVVPAATRAVKDTTALSSILLKHKLAQVTDLIPACSMTGGCPNVSGSRMPAAPCKAHHIHARDKVTWHSLRHCPTLAQTELQSMTVRMGTGLAIGLSPVRAADSSALQLTAVCYPRDVKKLVGGLLSEKAAFRLSRWRFS